MRVGARIEQDALEEPRGAGDPIAKRTFVVRLTTVDRGAELLCASRESRVDFREGGFSINRRLPRPQELQVGAGEAKNGDARPSVRLRMGGRVPTLHRGVSPEIPEGRASRGRRVATGKESFRARP